MVVEYANGVDRDPSDLIEKDAGDQDRGGSIRRKTMPKSSELMLKKSLGK